MPERLRDKARTSSLAGRFRVRMEPDLSNYSGSAERSEQAKALGGVIAIHLALALVILTGLDVRAVSETGQRLKTFTIVQPAPPPMPAREQSKLNLKDRPARSSVAPRPKMKPAPIVSQTVGPSPLHVANSLQAGKGSVPAQSGTEAGNGTAPGSAGGAPDYARFTPAQLVRNLSNHDYRAIAQGRVARGSAMLLLRIAPSGLPDSCSIVRSSGDPMVDMGLCPLVEARLRFRPALDDQGRPIAYQLQYVATWSL